MQKLAVIQYWRARLTMSKNGYVDVDMLEKRRRIAEIQSNEMLTQKQIRQKIKDARDEWHEFKTEAKSERERYLLDMHAEHIDENDTEMLERREKIVKKIANNEKRNWTFKYLTEEIGRGPNKTLKRLCINDQNTN